MRLGMTLLGASEVGVSGFVIIGSDFLVSVVFLVVSALIVDLASDESDVDFAEVVLVGLTYPPKILG